MRGEELPISGVFKMRMGCILSEWVSDFSE